MAAVCDAGEAFYVKPDAGMLLGSPADTTPSHPCDARPEEVDVALGIEAIEAAIALEVRGVRAPMGRLAHLHRRPRAHRRPRSGAPRLRLAGRPGRLRHQTSPAMAWAAASVVLDEPWPEALTGAGVDARTLDPVRFR